MDLLLFNPFQPSVVFHIETFICIKLQIMPGFYMEWCTGLIWVTREDFLPQILNLVCQNISKEALLTGPKIQAKIPSHSGDCVLGEGQLVVMGESLGEGQGDDQRFRGYST